MRYCYLFCWSSIKFLCYVWSIYCCLRGKRSQRPKVHILWFTSKGPTMAPGQDWSQKLGTNWASAWVVAVNYLNHQLLLTGKKLESRAELGLDARLCDMQSSKYFNCWAKCPPWLVQEKDLLPQDSPEWRSLDLACAVLQNTLDWIWCNAISTSLESFTNLSEVSHDVTLRIIVWSI